MRKWLFCVPIFALALIGSETSAQSSGTANSTPQFREKEQKNNAQMATEFAAKNAARRQAAAEAARRLAEAGKKKAAAGAKFVAKRSGVVGGVLGNPGKACAPAPGQESSC